MSDNFTYDPPDNERYFSAIVRYLDSTGDAKIADIIRGYSCSIRHSSNFSRKRWNAVFTEIIFYIPVDKLRDVTPEMKNELRLVCDRIMPPEAGLDVMVVDFSPILDSINAVSPVSSPSLTITTAVVERSLDDAERLLSTTGAISGVDRAHTALHGYLRAICENSGIAVTEDASMTELFRKIRAQHSSFKDLGTRSEDLVRVLNSMGSILDAMSPIRNRASVAHPNPSLIEEPEAMLVINSARTILHYIDAKLR